MKKKKAIYLCSFLIFAVLIGFAIVIIFNCKNRDSIKTEMYVLSQRHGYFPGAYEYDGELYSRSVDGIVKYNENKEKTEIIKVDSEFFDYTISNNRIYLVSFGDGTAFLSTFSMSGEPLSKQQKLPVKSLSMIGVVDNYLIGNTSTEKDKRIFKVFDMEHGLKETDITLSEYAEKSREYCSYGFDFILASLENDGYFVYNNDFIKSSSERYLAANDKYFAYVYNIVSPTIEFLDIDSGEIKKINNSQLYPYSKVVFSHLDGDILTVSFSQNSPNFWDDNNLLEGTNKLKYHRYDAYAVINLKTGKVVKKHKFDTYERIIFINDEKIITYKDGKYIEYSADSFKKISEQDASEIKADGRYIFYSHNNYIFIFDDNTGEMINRISAL